MNTNSYIDLIRIAQKLGFEIEAKFKATAIPNYNYFNGWYSIRDNKQMVGKSNPMIALFYLLQIAAESDSTVLLLGESGTGKELAARALHYNGSRYKPPLDNFVVVNCGAIPEALMESELFGYAPGAFTSASSKGYTGAFEKARNGTIVLDEIGYAPMHLQHKLLRVLEDKTIQKLGDGRPIPLGNIRVVASTNKDIGALVAEHKFHEDLFYRLSRIPIYLPSLRERSTDDVRALIYYFASNGVSGKDLIEPEAVEKLLDLSFRGNVRSLENLITHAKTFEGELPITAERMEKYLPFVIAAEMVLNGDHVGVTDAFNLKEAEKRIIMNALALTHGQQKKAAELLGISDRVLCYKLKKMEIKKMMEKDLTIMDKKNRLLKHNS